MCEFSVSRRRSDSETFVDASAELFADPSLRGSRLPDVIRFLTGATNSSGADAAITEQRAVSDQSIAWKCPELSSRRPRLSSPAMEAFRVVLLVVTPFASMFANPDVAIESTKPSTAVPSTKSLPSDAGLAAVGDVDMWPKVQLAMDVSSTGTPKHSDDLLNVTEENVTALQPVLHLEKATTAPEVDGRHRRAATNLSAMKTSQLDQAQPGVWTSCVVNLIPTGQIAVQNAMSYRSCVSIGKKCAGARRYANIQYFDPPTWVSSSPLDVCYAES